MASPAYRTAPPCSTDGRGACAASMYALIFIASRRAASATPRALALVTLSADGEAPALPWGTGPLAVFAGGGSRGRAAAVAAVAASAARSAPPVASGGRALGAGFLPSSLLAPASALPPRHAAHAMSG